VRDIGRRLAAFHADAPVRRPPGTTAACRAAVGATVSALRSFLPGRALLLSREERLVRSVIDRCRRELEWRVRHGYVRDGHGDVRAEPVLLTQPPALVDCIEFDATRRTMDVGADLARLKVDLTARGKPQLGDELVAAYRNAGGDPGEDHLLDLWCAHESLEAARIVLSRHGHAAIGRAETLLDLAAHFANSAIGAGDRARCGRP